MRSKSINRKSLIAIGISIIAIFITVSFGCKQMITPLKLYTGTIAKIFNKVFENIKYDL